MTEAGRERVVDFSEIFRRIVRRFRVVLVVTVVATLLGIAAGLLAPKEYTATATLTVSPISLDPLASSSAAQQININTEREVLRSSEVARIAAEELGGVDPNLLNQNSSVAAPSGSQVLQVSVSAPDPRLAADRANAMANAYLAFRGEGAAQLAAGRINEIDARIADAEEAGNAAAVADLRSNRLALSQVSENPGRIIGVAQPPTAPSSFGMLVFVAGGLAAGLLAGAALALLREFTDRLIRVPERLAERTGAESFVVRGADDLEGFRWVLRAVRAPFVGVRRTRPVVVAVLGAAPGDTSSVVAGLRDLATETGAGVVVIDEARLPETKLDRPWKYQPPKGGGVSLVLVDGDHVRSGARRATLADGADVAIVVAAARSKVSDLRGLLESIGRSELSAVIPVFTTHSARRSFARAVASVAAPAAREPREITPALATAER